MAQEKKKELEKRLQDVSGQLSNNKKPARKGEQRLPPSFTSAPAPGEARLRPPGPFPGGPVLGAVEQGFPAGFHERQKGPRQLVSCCWRFSS